MFSGFLGSHGKMQGFVQDQTQMSEEGSASGLQEVHWLSSLHTAVVNWGTAKVNTH